MAPEEEADRKPIPLIMHVAVVLYKLGRCAECRVVANQFGVHKSTVKKSVYIFSICKGMMKDLIRMPGEEKASEIPPLKPITISLGLVIFIPIEVFIWSIFIRVELLNWLQCPM